MPTKAKSNGAIEEALQRNPEVEMEMIQYKLEQTEDDAEREELIARRRELRRDSRKRRLMRELEDLENGMDEDVIY